MATSLIVVGAADDHAFVDFRSGPDEEAAALLEAHQRVAGHRTGFARDERADVAAGNLAAPGLMVVVRVRHDRGAARQGQQFAAQTEDRTGRHRVLEPARIADVDHVRHDRLALAERLDDGAGVLFLNVDDDVLDRLVLLAVSLG